MLLGTDPGCASQAQEQHQRDKPHQSAMKRHGERNSSFNNSHLDQQAIKTSCIASDKCSASAVKVTDPICRIGSLRELFGDVLASLRSPRLPLSSSSLHPRWRWWGLPTSTSIPYESTSRYRTSVTAQLCVVLVLLHCRFALRIIHGWQC